MTNVLDLMFADPPPEPPSGNPDRFATRWHLVGAGLSNVWRYGNLELAAVSGRLLLRGPNGTGKTTALEALWPFLLDLDHGPGRLSAGKARTTTLKQLMSEGATKTSGRRYGYVWLTLAAPEGAHLPEHTTYGVRLQYSASASPAVKIVPFTAPGRPLHDLSLSAPDGRALEHEDFKAAVEQAGGTVFDSTEEYVEDLASRVFAATPRELRDLAGRLRQVRNPVLLGELSADRAAEALRESLPKVDAGIIAETAEALAASDSTREAFARDKAAAESLSGFASVWAGHVVDVAKAKLSAAQQTSADVKSRQAALAKAEKTAQDAADKARLSQEKFENLDRQRRTAEGEVRAIEESAAYRAAGQVRELERRLAAEQRSAHHTAVALTTTAAGAAAASTAAADALDNVSEQLVRILATAAETGVVVPAPESLLTRREHPRRVRSAGGVIPNADAPGAALTVTCDEDSWNDSAAQWSKTSVELTRAADTAQLLVSDFQTVEDAKRQCDTAGHLLGQAENLLAKEQLTLTAATDAATTSAGKLLEETAIWTRTHEHLALIDVTAPDAGAEWVVDDVEALAPDDTALALDTAARWAAHALATAERVAAGHESTAEAHVLDAGTLEAEAGSKRAQAAELRAGRLLPFPRPNWAGAGDDTLALGSVLEWRADVDTLARNRLEAALSHSGLLTAHLEAVGDNSAAVTPVWSVRAGGAAVEPNLLHVLDVDPEHPSASAAVEVLQRIALADTAVGNDAHGAVLVVGRDGTFAAGLLTGDPAAAAVEAHGGVLEAQHVGARTRRERARVEAASLDAAAKDLESQAARARKAAGERRRDAEAAREAGRLFPNRTDLESLESARAGAAVRMRRATDERDTADTAYQAARRGHQEQWTSWSRQATQLGLVADVAQLTALVDDNRSRAKILTTTSKDLESLQLGSLARALRLLPDEPALTHELDVRESETRQAFETADATQRLLEEVSRESGVEDAVRRHRDAERKRNRLIALLGLAQSQATDDGEVATRADTLVNPAQQALADVLPAQATAFALLHALLTWPPAAAALNVPGLLNSTASGQVDALGEGADLLADAEALLARKPTSARRTLDERYDSVRAELAQTWTLARGEEAPPGVDVEAFVLTHDDQTYDPPAAAARAAGMAARAESALAEAEAEALQEFVVGKLPTAIGHAWQQLQDWKNSVNDKMRSATASSGVGVQVRITKRDDLDPLAQTVFQLSCAVSDAVRTEAQKQEVGTAIHQRLAASDGDTKAEQLADAVDITAWVDVKYAVVRPTAEGTPGPERVWGRNTGLSGGERRLVVLAPMLAAVAAGYDRMGESALRLLPLDEVPAEVDEPGREGLARYIAQLDLDLLATSYLWDGAPNAWDGVDAHDLESASDGTVVAFPMVIRGVQPLPGDDDSTGHHPQRPSEER